MSDRCKVCKRLLWPWSRKNHHCPPKWECVSLDYVEDAQEADDEDCWESVFANSASEAAEQFKEQMDCDDGEGAVCGDVLVRDKDGKVTKFFVTVEMVPEYSVEEVAYE